MNNVLRTFRSHFINTEFVGATPEASVVLIQITLLLGGLSFVCGCVIRQTGLSDLACGHRQIAHPLDHCAQSVGPLGRQMVV